jgi:hypothetical protein
MSKFKKPLNIFGVLENSMITTQYMEKTKQVVGYISELSQRYNLDDEVLDYAEVSKLFTEEDLKKAEIIRDFDQERNTHKSEFNTQYKNSLRKLFKEHGLPVHINAFDIHRMNIDVESVDKLVDKIRNNEEFKTMDFFTDDNIPAFCTAPYPLTFVQLENLDTYRQSIGKVIYETNRNNTEEIDYMLDYTGLSEEKVIESIRQDCQTYMLVQSYDLNDYVGHLHMYGENHNGLNLNDTLRNVFDIDNKFEEFVAGTDDITIQEMQDKLKWIQIVDVIQIFDDELFLEEQIITFLDKHGVPKLAKSTLGGNRADVDDEDIASNTQYYLTSLEKVFQWWNSDNDILDETVLETNPSWKKRLKQYRKYDKKANLIYKTLTVKPTLKVVDNGVERSPRLEELVAHMRRGHWAHYGVNGKGLLFGKWARSVYRKPSVVGKLSNGLIIKDYTLETE